MAVGIVQVGTKLGKLTLIKIMAKNRIFQTEGSLKEIEEPLFLLAMKFSIECNV